jgi:PAS domain-containing protein
MNHKRSSIGIPLLAAFFLGTGYAAVEAYFFHHGDFADLLFFRGSSKELFFRLFIIATAGTILFRALRRHNQALDAFRESNETLITITAAAKDAIVMMDHRGIVSFWNPAAERIFGHSAAEAIGRTAYAAGPPAVS